MAMVGELRHEITLGTDPFGNIQRMDNYLESLESKLENCKTQVAEIEQQTETAKQEVLRPFGKEVELAAHLVRLSELNILLDMSKEEEKPTQDNEEELENE